jgi:hypothetical protein
VTANQATRTPPKRAWPWGWIGLATVAASWAYLFLRWWRDHWSVDFTFFVGAASLFAVLTLLSAHATYDAARGRPDALRQPEWAQDFQEYFQWLAPVGFTAGMIFAHFFWH